MEKSNGAGDGQAALGLSIPKTPSSHSSAAGGNASPPLIERPTKQVPVFPHFLPNELEPLAWIAGKWIVHEPGVVRYPTMKADFKYSERIEFTFGGQKMLDYKAESWNPAIGPTALMHREVGFLRIKPGSTDVALVIAHNFGVSEILEGKVSENSMWLMTSGISRMAFAAEPAVVANRRTFTFDPATEELEHVMEMQTTRTALTEHLRIKYKRDTHQVPDAHK
ncbi:putative THAP domain-containing protein 4 [Hypsibius exemplaris]|uniref:THAP domain-containing protein 4 n=1 Tax=Hypsibius exemplaris TaxID=2072580 RepID=A0A1W0X9S0_HYPEX|nr:putative THAP domain-containing protein 4 [Hypsibius exemplaris]